MAAPRVLTFLERRDALGELFPDHFFLRTNAPQEEVSAPELLERYRGRDRAEKDFGDRKCPL